MVSQLCNGDSGQVDGKKVIVTSMSDQNIP